MEQLGARSRLGLVAGVLLAALLLAPLLGSGYVLVRDMSFVPRTPLGGQLLGLDDVPRGVPSELVIALLSRVLAMGWLQDLVLVALVVVGAWGAARLAPTSSRAGALAAATAYGWSPYLHERLLLGQWALLLGWAVLPWAVRAALVWRDGGAAWPTMGALSVAALGGANSLLLVGLTVVLVGRFWRALGAVAVLSLPWAVPGFLQDQVKGDAGGVAAFAANSDSHLGVVGSVLTGGGVWARSAVPDGRSAGAWIALALLLLAGTGVPLLRQRIGDRLLVAGGLGLVLALLGVAPGTDRLLRWAVVNVPSAGLLRDGQKWVLPLVLLISAALACAVDAVLTRVVEVPVKRVLAGLLVLAPLAALPGAAWGEGGRLEVSHYPDDWERVTKQAHGAVLVLPWTLYRAFPWEHQVPLLDPATKMLQRPVVNDALPLPGGSVRGEDPLAHRLDPAVTAGGPLLADLQREGISQVLVERTTAGLDGSLVARQVQGLTVAVETPELTLYDVPGGGREQEKVSAWPVVLADLVALAFVLLTAVRLLAQDRREL
jgi:hypothetical protein